MKTIDLNSEDLKNALFPEDMEVALVGDVKLDHVRELQCHFLDVLDLSGANFGIEEEKWYVGGYSHSGWCGRSGVRDVEVLKRMLEECMAVTVILPDDVARRHLNAVKKNVYVHNVVVSEKCKLFSMKDGNVYNKKGTILQYEQREVIYGVCADCGKKDILERFYETVDGTSICHDCYIDNDWSMCVECGKLFNGREAPGCILCPNCCV